MSTPIRIKRSSQPGKRPTTEQLQLGELAFNFNDGHLYSKRDTAGVGIGTTIALLTPWKENFGGDFIYYDNSVGIGSTQPTSKLDVAGDVYIASNLVADGTISFTGISTFNSNVDINASVDILNDLVVNRNLNITGLSTFGSDVDINASVDISNDLVVNGNFSVVGLSTFTSDLDINASIDVDGHTELDNLNVSGVSTFASAVDINANLDVDGFTELDATNISETLNVVGVSTFASDIDINASIDVDGHTELDNLNVSGVATFAQNVEITGNLTVNGTQTILNTTQLEVEDINIGIASADPKLSNAALDGAGITIYGAAGDKTLTWSNANSRMEFNTDLFVPNISSTDLTLTGDLDVDGHTELDNLNVSGVSTFAGAADFNGDVDIDGRTELDITNISETLNVVGISTFESDVDINASIDVDGHTELDDLNVSGVSTFASAVDINSNLDVDGRTELDITNISETLNVVGVSTFGSDVDINASVDIDGHTELDDLNVSGVSTFASTVDINSNLDVDGITELDTTNISETLNVVGISTFGSDIDINASIDVDGHTELDDLNVSGVSTFAGSADFNGDVDVDGFTELDATNISETLNVVGVSTFESDIDINASIDVDGHTELDDLNVSGVSTFAGAIDANGDLDVDGRTELDVTNISETLNVVGISTFGSDVDINASIDVDGHTELDDLNVSGVSTFASTVDINADLDVDGFTELDSTNISETLNVVGLTTLGSAVDINADLDVDGFTELDSTNISETLNVVGLTTLGSNVDINADLDVDGFTELDSTNISETLNVVGLTTLGSNVDINADLDVDGRTELDITNISETLNVVGISTFGSDIDINASIDVDGHTELDDLNVSGVSTFSGAADFNGDVDVDGHTELDTLNVSIATTTASLTLANAGVAVTAILDEDGLTSDRADALATQQSIKAYVDAQVTAQDLDFAGDTGTGAVDLDSQTFSVFGTPNEIETAAAGQSVTIGLPANVTITNQLNVGGGLAVTGITTLSSDVDINASVDIDGHTELDDLNVSGVSTFSGAIDANGNLDVDGFTELDATNISETLNVVGLSTFGSDVDINASIDVDGHTELDDLNVSGVATFAQNVEITGNLTVNGTQTILNTSQLEVEDINIGIASADPKLSNAALDGAGITIYGAAGDKTLTWSNANSRMEFNTDLFAPNIESTNLTLSGGLEVTGVSTFTSTIDANGNVDVAGTLDVDGHTELDNLNVSGVSTFAGAADFNGDVDIDGRTELDITNISETLNVVGVSTFSSNVDINASIDVSGHTELDTLNVSVATTTASLTLANVGVAVTAILDEDGLTSDRADALATQQSIKAYVDAQVTAQDLDFAGDTGTGAVDLDSQTFTISGTFNEIETSASGQTISIGLPNEVAITTSLTVGSATTITGSGIIAGIVTGTLDNDLTLSTSGTGLSGSATYNNSGATTFTVTSNATDSNTGGTIVARDGSGNFSAGTITANLSGTATTATNLADGANITTGTISDDRLPDLITSNINITTGVSTVGTLDVTNATIDNLTFTSGTAITSVDTDLTTVSGSDDTLASAKAIKAYVDAQVTAQDLDFIGDTGTGAVDLDSQSLTISGTANEIETSASGQTLTVGLPNQVAITTSLTVGSATTITGSGIIAGIVTGTLDNTLTLNTSGTGLSGSTTYNNSGASTFTVTSNATNSNTGGTVVARDGSGNFSAGTITANLTGNVTGNLTGVASTATKLENARDFSITGSFVTASAVSFDGTGNVALGATITPDSITLGTYTSGDYVQSITGTANEVEVTGGSGEGSTPQIGLPNDVIIGQDLVVTRDVQINRDLNVAGNITIGGTSGTLFTETLQIADADLVLGIRTDAFGNDVSTDSTANHGGIAIASTEGNPLVNLNIVGIETLSPTYKKIMWFKAGSFSGLGTDAWLANYAVGIGSTQFPTGTRLAAGNVQFTENDLTVVRNINASGIITGTLDNTLTLGTSGTGLSGSTTYNNSGAATFTVTSNATSANTAGTIVARDGSGNFSAGTITANLIGNVTGDLTGTATTATNLANGANITTGTISDDRLPDLITSNINITTGVSTIGTLDVVSVVADSLSVSGVSTFSDDVSIADKIVHTGNTNTAIRFPANDTFTVETAGSERVRVTSGGNVGIGTNAPTEKLDVNGDIRLRGAIYDSLNNVGSVNQILVSNAGAGVTWTDITSIPVGDASTLDGLDSTQFLRSDVADTKSGITTFSDGVILQSTLNVSGVTTASSFVKSGGTSSQFLKADGSVDSNTYLTSYTETQTLNDVLVLGNVSGIGISVGVATASSFVKSGGTSSQFLKADGSVDSNTYLTAETDTLNDVTSRGNTTSNGMSVGVVTASSFVKSGGTSSQFLKADGSVDSSTYLTSYTETQTLNDVLTLGNVSGIGISVGVATATSFVKSGGTSSEFLKADGSVDSSTYLTAETDTLDDVTSRGNTTSNGISVGVATASSFVKTGGTSLQFLKADGSVDSSTYLTSYTETQTIGDVLTLGNVTGIGMSVGVVTATAFVGDGSALTNLPAASIGINTNTTNLAQLIPFAVSYGSTTGLGATDGLVYNPSSGRMGIGSDAPAYTLDVAGDINSSTDVKINGTGVLDTALALAIALG